MRNYYMDSETRSIVDIVPGTEMGVTGVVLTRINVPSRYRGKGHGSDILKRVLADADATNTRIFLEPAASGGLDQDSLIEWYQRHGFKWMKGYVGCILVRHPRQLHSQLGETS